MTWKRFFKILHSFHSREIRISLGEEVVDSTMEKFCDVVDQQMVFEWKGFFILVFWTAVGAWAIARRSALSTVIWDSSECSGEGSGRSVGGKGCCYSDTEKDLNTWKSIPESEMDSSGKHCLSSKVFFHTSNLPERSANAYKTGRKLCSGWGKLPRWFNRLYVSLTSGFRELIWVSGVLNLLILC